MHTDLHGFFFLLGEWFLEGDSTSWCRDRLRVDFCYGFQTDFTEQVVIQYGGQGRETAVSASSYRASGDPQLASLAQNDRYFPAPSFLE